MPSTLSLQLRRLTLAVFLAAIFLPAVTHAAGTATGPSTTGVYTYRDTGTDIKHYYKRSDTGGAWLWLQKDDAGVSWVPIATLPKVRADYAEIIHGLTIVQSHAAPATPPDDPEPKADDPESKPAGGTSSGSRAACFPENPGALIVLPDFSKQECQNFDSIIYLLKQAVNLMIGLVLTVALIFLIITGYQFATSLGNKQGMEEAKRSLLYIVIGVVVVLSAFMIVRFLTDQYLR